MCKWKEIEFSDLLIDETLSYGIVQPGEDAVLDSVPIIRVQNIKNGKIETKDVKKVAKSIEENYKRTRLEGGELLITVVGSIGECAIVPQSLKGWNVARAISVAKIKNDYDINFIKYAFKTEDIIFQMYGNTNDTVQPTLNLSSLKSLKFNVPDLLDQRSIASILSSLDDKIDLLRRQNATLEKMAETLFRQWFVEEAFVQSGNQISLGDFIESVSITHKFPNSNVVFLNTSDIYLGNVLVHEQIEVITLPGQAKKTIKKGDILFSEIRPANGRWAYIDFEAENYVVSTKLMVLRSKGKINQAFIYFYLTNKEVVNWLQMLAESRSGTFPQITFDQLKDLILNIPSKEILDYATNWCELTLNKIKSNQTQIHTLTTLRNTLLPKLMSGEVKVENY